MSSGADAAAGLVLVERRARAAFVTLNRPEAANALSEGLVGALARVFADLAADVKGGADIRALVVTGAGKVFCAGADLKERRAMTLEQTWAFLDVLNRLMNAIAAFPRPVIAAINGAAFGGGLELALACDLRVAADTAEMGLTEVRIGVIPGAGGTQRLARVASVAAAKELILTGRRVRAARARELGIVAEVVPAAELAAAAAKLADDIAAAGPLAVAAAKRAIDDGAALPLGDGLALEAACYEEVLASDDRNEGLNAFAEKRAPVFKGR
ncbi:MAG TPA: enoyl-CoA hydratase-related protein [Polyangia bacterium]|jgi:enoyl-CoA hydratase/carnithine racemase